MLKTAGLGPLLEVEMAKKRPCDAILEVEMYNNNNIGENSAVEKVHALVAEQCGAHLEVKAEKLTDSEHRCRFCAPA